MRVIAGGLGGRRLKVPKGRDTRPTSDRVREAIFSSLGALEGVRVLDLFAGSGAMGIEALSRGAERACFVERNKTALRVIRDNLATLGLIDRSEVIVGDVLRALRSFSAAQAGPSFDLVFVDPPYESPERNEVLAALLASGVLASGARLVVECSSHRPLEPPVGFERRSERRYGDTLVVQLVVLKSSGGPAGPGEPSVQESSG